MTRRFFQFGLVTMLVLAVGGHWVLLQSVAWMGMAIRYSQSAPLTEALRMTFDGQHPCSLCKAVKSGQNSERETPVSKPDTKLDLLCRESAPVVLPLRPSAVLAGADERALRRPEPPPLPPPRHA